MENLLKNERFAHVSAEELKKMKAEGLIAMEGKTVTLA